MSVNNTITEKFSKLQLQLDTTKQFAALSFAQVSEWTKKSLEVEQEHQQLSSFLHAQEKELAIKLQKDNWSDIETESLCTTISDSCSKCEILCLCKQKLSLKWDGYQIGDLEEELNWYKKLKFMVLTAERNAKNCKTSIENYQFYSQGLEQFLSVMEKILSSPPRVKNIDELQKYTTDLKHLLQFTVVCLGILKKNLQVLVMNFKGSETEKEHDAILLRASEVIAKTEEKIQELDSAKINLIKLQNALEESYHWLQQRYEPTKVMPSNLDHKEFLRLKSLQWDLQNFCYTIDYLKEQKIDASSHAKCTLIEESLSQIVDIFYPLVEDTDAKVNTLKFTKQWIGLKCEVRDLQTWVADSIGKIHHIAKNTEYENNIASLFQNIQDMVKLEAELKCQDSVHVFLRDTVDRGEHLQICEPDCTCNLNDISDHWKQVKESLMEVKKCVIDKLIHLERSEVEVQLELWLTAVEHSYNIVNLDHMDDLPKLKDTKYKICNPLMAMNFASDLVSSESWSRKHLEASATGNEPDVKNTLSAKRIHLLELKMKHKFDKLETLILQNREFDRLMTEMSELLKIIHCSLKSLKPGVWKKDQFSVYKTKRGIEASQKDLERCCKMFGDIKKLSKEISEGSKKDKSSQLKNSQKQLSTINSMIVSTLEETNVVSRLWVEYQRVSEKCRRFISSEKCVISAKCEAVVNEEHLSHSICTLEESLLNLKNSSELLKNTNEAGSKLKVHLNQFQYDIDVNLENLKQEWSYTEKWISNLIKEQRPLHIEWIEFNRLYSLLFGWLSRRQDESMCLKLNAPNGLKAFEIVIDELGANKIILASLNDIGSRILSSSQLHPTAQNNVRNALDSVKSSFKSLEAVLNGLHPNLLDIHREISADQCVLQNAELFLDESKNKLKTDLSYSKQEIENDLMAIEALLDGAAYNGAAVENIKRKLLLDGTADSATAIRVSKVLLCLQMMISEVTSRYLKLCKVYSESNSIAENITYLLKFLKNFRKFLSEIPSEYSEILTFYKKLQMADVLIHGNRSLVQCLIKDALQKFKAEDPRDLECNIQSLTAIQSEWDSLDALYESKVLEVKEVIHLWEVYSSQIHRVKIWTCNVETELNHHSITKNPSELEVATAKLQKIYNEGEEISGSIEKAKRAASALDSALGSETRLRIHEEIETLQQKFQHQVEVIERILGEMKECVIFLEKLDATLEAVKENVTSSCLFIHDHSPKGLDIHVQDTKFELEKMKEISVILGHSESQLAKVEAKMCVFDYKNEICIKKETSNALNSCLLQQIAIISEELIQQMNFVCMNEKLLHWNEVSSMRLKQHCFQSPEIVLEKIQMTIGKEVYAKQNVLESLKMMEKTQHEDLISEAMLSSTAIFSETLALLDSRKLKLTNVSQLKENMQELIGKINECLITAEEYVNRPVLFTEVSLKEVDGCIQYLQTLQQNIDLQGENLTACVYGTAQLMLEPDAFTCASEKVLFQHSTRSLSNRCALLKAMILEKRVYLVDVKETWTALFCLLKNLENWLTAKEKLSSEVDYCKLDNSRKVYLEGLEIFENLKHSFQDDVRLLHNSNAAYHAISKRDLDVSNHLQNRVLALNDRWHNLYKKVSDTLATVGDFLQLWDDYEQLQQHIHLFLTETHIKITTLEQSNALSQSESDTLMNEFLLHEEVLQRYNATANNLCQRSKSSADEVQCQVEEIQKYWAVVYDCLQSFRESIPKSVPVVKNQNLPEETASFETLRNVGTLDEIDLLSENVVKSKGLENAECGPVVSEGFDRKLLFTLETDTTQSCEEDLSTSVSQKNVTSEEEKLDMSSSPYGSHVAQKEFVEDLLSALEEAEDRIESLETVLSEPTPNGTEDDSGPNYSRLLAACRSSIDVIQHLNQLLSENLLDQHYESHEEAIRSRTEGMLIRWERIENSALNKESRAIENAKKWQQFSKQLKEIETWLLDTLQAHVSPSIIDADLEKFTTLLQKHEDLVSQIGVQQKAIITINVTGQKFISSGKEDAFSIVNDKLKAVNEHWDNLCSAALEWQNKLQTEFLQSSEFHSTISEMELWLKDSEERLQSLTLTNECSDKQLHEQRTEIFALKQQLDNCSQRVKTLLDISGKLFHEKERPLTDSHAGILEVQSRLASILSLSNCLLLECSKKLSALSKLLASRKVSQEATCENNPDMQDDGSPSRIRRCCNFLRRVARASVPIQAVLLLLLGAAVLLPRGEEEELSCRLSNNFASSLNPMLRYPDGPPPV